MGENLLTPSGVNPIASSKDGWSFMFKNNEHVKNNEHAISDNVLSTDVSTLNIESDRNVRLMKIFQKNLDNLVSEWEGKINSEKTRKEISGKVTELVDNVLSEQEFGKDVVLSYEPKKLPRKTKKGGNTKKNTKWRREYLRVMRHYPTYIFKNAKFVPVCDENQQERTKDSLCISMQIDSDTIETVFKS